MSPEDRPKGSTESARRELPEPHDRLHPVPFPFIVVSFLLLLWAGLYLAFNCADFRSDVYDANLAGAMGLQTSRAPLDERQLGRRLFTQNCVVCHQTTGLGVPGQFPPLVSSEWVVGGDWQGDNHLALILLHGLQGPVQVRGSNYNGAMPPWKHLNDAQIASILSYIRSEWGNSASPIPAEHVKKLREASSDRVRAWTQQELKAVPPESVPATKD